MATKPSERPNRKGTPIRKGMFRVVAERTAEACGSPGAIVAALVLVAVWALSGFVFEFSANWQMVINTITNVVTLFIVFLIQNTQNRDAKAVHLKLDELIRAMTDARTQLVGLENLSDEDLQRLDRQFRRIREREIRKLAQKTNAEGG